VFGIQFAPRHEVVARELGRVCKPGGVIGPLFAGTGVSLRFERGMNPFRFDSAEHYATFMETNYGPTLKACERLTAEGRWDDCRREIVDMMVRRNEARDGSLTVPAEYLLAVARKDESS
jgi:hypothetical protein